MTQVQQRLLSLVILMVLLTFFIAPSSQGHEKDRFKEMVVTAGEESVRELGREGLKATLEDAFTKQGVDINQPYVQSTIDSAVDETFREGQAGDAVTASVFEREDPSGPFSNTTVTVQPSRADEQLISHEAGHRDIYEMGTDLLNDRLEEEGQLSTSRFESIVGFTNGADEIYEATTQNGTQGGPNQEEIAENVFEASMIILTIGLPGSPL